MSGADEDGVDGVASGAGETVAFEQAVGLGMADDRLDRGSSAQLAFDRRRSLARALREVDFRRRRCSLPRSERSGSRTCADILSGVGIWMRRS